jgi:hypothetical protein
MRALYRAYRERPAIVPQVVAQLPWGHNIILLEKPTEPVAPGWSRAILEAQIATRIDRRENRARNAPYPVQVSPAHRVALRPLLLLRLLLGRGRLVATIAVRSAPPRRRR